MPHSIEHHTGAGEGACAKVPPESPADQADRPAAPSQAVADADADAAADLHLQSGKLTRWLYMAFALLCLALGLIGVVVPGMPTTVFILMAAWAAARSSPRLHAWLFNHRLFGPMLRDWQNGGTVSRSAKRKATLMMVLCAAVLPLTHAPTWAVLLALGCMAGVLIWLWCRPEPGPQQAKASDRAS